MLMYDSTTRHIDMEIFRGQRFSVSLLAIGQARTPTTTQVTALTQTSRLKGNQSIQALPRQGSNLTYNVYSAKNHTVLALHPSGPCHDSGLARLLINVTFLACPAGFVLSEDACICEERLWEYDASCSIDERCVITKRKGSVFWIGVASHDNGTYRGLILYHACPTQYCKSQTLAITLDNLDVQCDYRRGGVLCGKCTKNYSLLLGSPRCEICSNDYLALLFPFSIAGIALVAFLSALKLTVATGTLNSLILYANIVQVNRHILMPLDQINVLTVFVAWLNLDLGFETCLYDGMTAYAHTWLQFVFPIYVWMLVISIILASRYSRLVSKVLGSNPVAVLATLLLMSYNKILRVIIEVYSSAKLDYPGGEKITVWLKDGNYPYLHSYHLGLTVMTTLILVCIFLPYTFLLLLGYKLYRFSDGKYFPNRLLNRVRPFLESYYAPFRSSSRYWTGLLLLVRCSLYIVFSFNSIGGSRISLLAIIVTFTAMVGFSGSGRLYKSIVPNVVETVTYFNLVFLSAATVTKFNSPALVYTLVGIVFATMCFLIIYQVSHLYISKTATLQRVITPFFSLFKSNKTQNPETNSLAAPGACNPQATVSVISVELREPLLDN